MGERIERFKIPATGILGAGTGAAVSELTAETLAKASAQTGWRKVGVKGLVKGGFCLLFYGISQRVPGLWSLFTELASYSSFGSIVPDVIYELTPGGLWGLAEKAAVSMRTWALGAAKVKAEIEALEAAGETPGIPAGITVK